MTETVTDTACRVLENLTVILQSGTFPGYMAGELHECRSFVSKMLEQARTDQELANQPKSETPADDQEQIAAAYAYDFVTDGQLGPVVPEKRKRGRPRKAK